MDVSRIINMACAFYDSCVLFTASDAGIFGALAQLGRSDAATVARTRGLNERGARLLLDACAALGLVGKSGDLYYNTDETAVFLTPGSSHDLSAAIRYNRDVYGAWGKLRELVETGRPVERPELHLGADAERTRAFILAMHSRALAIGQAVVPRMELGGRKRLLDVGGGPGTYSMLIARSYPEIECTALDLPEVVKVADELIAAERMERRVRTLGADYHTARFPASNDVIIFFGALHQESPDCIVNLLGQAYESLVPGGAIYVLDMMTDHTHTAPKFSALFAINMALTTHDGWVFSDAELANWAKDAGFERFACRPLPPPMPHWLATAYKPES